MIPMPPAALLPPDAVSMLQKAAAIPKEHDRKIAVQKAIDKVKLMYPEHFKKEQ